jgi:hypothetical protein
MPTVSTTAALITALNACVGGETILLQPGTYADFSYWKSGGAGTATTLFPSNVTIQSLDPSNPATFNAFVFSGVQNITAKYLRFKYNPASGEPTYTRRFECNNCTNIRYSYCTFEGGLASGQADETANGYGTGYGFFAAGTDGLIIDHCLSSLWVFAFIITECTDITFSNNEGHSMSSDMVQFSGCGGVTITGNYIHDFSLHPLSSSHPDGIQFHTNTMTIPNTDILIENNIINQGSGDWTQSIFMGNEAIGSQGAGAEMRYQNVTIRNNLIVNGHLHGISCDQVDNITVDNNTIVQSANPYTEIPIVGFPTVNIGGATNSIISDNIVSTMNGLNASDGTKTNNFVKQFTNSGGANYYANLVTGAYDGSALADLGAGASFVAEPDLVLPAVETWTLTLT